MHNLDWDNLRYVLVVAETGSVAAAARVLKVNRTTVLRRINSLERQLDYRLFHRTGAGYVIAPEAEQMLRTARAVENAVLDLELKAANPALRLEGELRVTTTDSVLAVVVTHLADFHQLHPGVRIELAITNSRLNLTKRDADVAIRPTRHPPENLAGIRVSDLGFAIYAAPGYLNKHPDKDLREHTWLGVDELLMASPAGKWVNKHVPEANISLRADSFVALGMATERGLGLALLPCLVGESSPTLVRVGEPLPELKTGLWILTHTELMKSARVRALVDHLSASLPTEQDRLAGAAS